MWIESVIDFLLWFTAQAGKTAVAARNALSFLLDRLLEAWASEAAWMLEEATCREIDCVSEELLGAGMGVALLIENPG